MNGPLAALDGALGSVVERAVRSHHRRRLRRAGWGGALRESSQGTGWIHGGPAPRDGNAIRVLIDGDETLLAMTEAITGATRSVEIAGWLVDPGFGMPCRRADGTIHWVPLRTLLAEVAERADVRILVWAGFPHGPKRACRPQVREAARQLTVGTRIRCALDAHERPLHCHHEKTVVVDGRVAFVGGVDLTDFVTPRADSSAHHPRGTSGWHDVATQLEGPIVADVAAHVRLRWHETTGEQLPAVEVPESAGAVALQLNRTIPEHVYGAVPRGEYGILAAYIAAVATAERLIYIENQFLWAPEIVDVLADRLRNPPSDDFRVVIVLPTKPASGSDDTRGQLAVLEQADQAAGGVSRFLACALFAHGADPAGQVSGVAGQTRIGPDPIYVHAKVCVVDDRWLTVGSANLNDHSLFNDTEVNVTAHDEQLARETRERLWAEHLELPLDEVCGVDPVHLIDTVWRTTAQAQSLRHARGQLPTHRLTTLPGSSSRSDRLIGPLESLAVDG